MFSLSANPSPLSNSQDCHSNLNGIDFVKFLCSLLVFIIHIPPFPGDSSNFAKYINWVFPHYLCRIAVPFYFVCSGFFLFRKMSTDNLDTDVIKHYCFKILRLIGTWHVLLFIGGKAHLWYLGATVIAVTLLSLCFYFRLNIKHICILACLLYVIGLLGDSYNGLIAPLSSIPIFRYLFKGYTFAFHTTRNGIFMGFIFVLMGAIFSRRTKKINPYTSAFGFLVSMVCLFAEVYLLKSHNIPIDFNMYIFLLPAVYFLFSFAVTIQLKEHSIYKHLRNIGMLVYFLHLFVNRIVSLGISMLDKHLSFSIGNYQFFISIFLTIVIAVFLDWLSAKKMFQWIRWTLA